MEVAERAFPALSGHFTHRLGVALSLPAGGIQVAVARPMAPEEPVRPRRVRIALRQAADPEFRLLPVFHPLVAFEGALHGPSGPGLRGGLGVRLCLVPLLAMHEVPRDLDAGPCVVQAVVFLAFDEAIERRLPVREIAQFLVRPGERPVDGRIGRQLEALRQAASGVVPSLQRHVSAAQRGEDIGLLARGGLPFGRVRRGGLPVAITRSARIKGACGLVFSTTRGRYFLTARSGRTYRWTIAWSR